jgi:hypothetical protein
MIMMTRFSTIAALSVAVLAFAAPSQAQHSRGGGGAGGGGRAVAAPRSGGTVVAPRGGSAVVGRPYYGRPYYYGPRFSFGFYSGYPYYSPYYYPYGYYGSYAYGYPYGGYPYAPYGGGYAVSAGEARGYGSVRIQDASRDAQVYADGYYVGTVDDFDGTFQHLDLEAGPHRIEIRPQGQAPISVEVNVRPGETITYHAR